MPAMSYSSWRAARALVVALLTCGACVLPSALAQTGPELLVKPFDKDVNYEINASAVFEQTGEDDFGKQDLGVNVYEVSALAEDVWDADGWKRMHEAGVTEVQVLPWYSHNDGGDPDDLDVRLASLGRFADDVLAKFR